MKINAVSNPGRDVVAYDSTGRPYPRSRWLMNVQYETNQERYDHGSMGIGRIVAWPRCWEPVNYA